MTCVHKFTNFHFIVDHKYYRNNEFAEWITSNEITNERLNKESWWCRGHGCWLFFLMPCFQSKVFAKILEATWKMTRFRKRKSSVPFKSCEALEQQKFCRDPNAQIASKFNHFVSGFEKFGKNSLFTLTIFFNKKL